MLRAPVQAGSLVLSAPVAPSVEVLVSRDAIRTEERTGACLAHARASVE